ncbi:DUF4386 domain-containing protein [Massilia sp. Dwa41.01b]|nr:DUF4386 domain-containing protein [Massilia sp. Dwa41.01b]QNB01259.1 DUF4386 domain-containing protein [Massilia sp. Se16.2.3]
MPIQAWARFAGILYLLIIVIGLFGETVIRGTLVVTGDPAATAQHILATPSLWRLGIAAQDLLLICAVGLTFTCYLLLRPVDRNLARLLVCFALVSLAVESISALHLHAVLTPLSDAAYLKAVDPQLLYLTAYQSIVAHAHAFGLALIFFGIECLIAGHLIRKSGFFPKWIGVLMQLAGAGYLINSFSMILSPALQALLFPFILLPALVGESAFCLWLLLKGVDGAAWERRAAAA